MALTDTKKAEAVEPEAVGPDDELLQNLKDYTAMAFALIWQRQAIFLSATLLTAFYFNPLNAFLFYVLILFFEVQDIVLARRVAVLKVHQRKAINLSLFWILVNTVLSSLAICIYAISVAFSQESGGHFTPLFFLFAAALFAAMNNHQLVMALAIRLALYGVSFVIIVVRDLWVERPPLTSELWLHFFTVIFVMYFLIDCSIVFLKLYRKNLAHLNKLHKEHERTKAAYKIKSQFVSTVSHELRTPLTSIKVSLDLLNTGALGPIPANMQTIVETAGKNSDRLSRLIDDVLDLQKLEAGEMTYRMEVLNVQVFLTDAVEGNAGFADMHRVTLMPEFDEKPWLFVEADEMRLMQVLSNVISNAVKFSNQGDIVTVGCMTLDSRVRIYVQDRGKGIPQGSEDKVFGRFSQIDSSDRRQVGGTGLGMNISREIVEHFKGTLTYESSEGQGTTFFIDLPPAMMEGSGSRAAE